MSVQAERYAQEARTAACDAAGEAADAAVLAASYGDCAAPGKNRSRAEAAARIAYKAAVAAFEALVATEAAARDDPRMALHARTRAFIARDEAAEARAAGAAAT